MLVQGPQSYRGREAIFLHCESAEASNAIARGDCVMWDLVDNRAVSGIMAETRGIRILRATGTAIQAGMRIAGIAEDSFPVTPANRRGNVGLVQIYGFHDAVLLGGFAGTAGDYWLMYNGIDGSLNAVRTPGSVGAGLAYCGTGLEDSTVAFQTRPAWLRCM